MFSLIPYIPVDNLVPKLFEYLATFRSIIPPQGYELIYTTASDMLENGSGLLSFGVIATLYFATNGVSTLMDSFDKIHHTFKRRSYLRQKLIALLLTIFLIIFFLIILTIALVGEYYLDNAAEHIGNNIIQYLIFNIAHGGVVIFLFFFTISFLYYYGPAVHEKWRFITPGSTLATILSLLTCLGFAYYVENFGQYNKFYGSLGAIIIIMIWMYLNSMILIIGFELNAGIYAHKGTAKNLGDYTQPTLFDNETDI